MTYLISKSKYKVLNLLLNKKQINNEMIEISEEKYNELKTVDSTLICEIKQPQYYWYVSQTHPSLNYYIAKNCEEGWHLIGKESDIASYVYDPTISTFTIEGEDEAPWYIAIPKNTGLFLYDQQGNAWGGTESDSITFNEIDYNIYEFPALWDWNSYILKKK